MSLTATYVDSSTFTVSGDKTTEFVLNRRVKANCGTDGSKFSSVSSSSYDSGADETTVNLNDSVLTSNLSEVWFGVVPPPGPESAFPVAGILRPSITSPNDGATDVSLSGTLVGNSYRSLYSGDSRDYRQFQIDLSSGDFSSPVVDATQNADDYSYNGLDTGTEYKARIRDKSINGYYSEWSEVITFTTFSYTVYGIALVSTGGGAGDWQKVDGDGNNITLSTTNFDNHPIWGNIADATVDGQAMVKIPKFWVKTGTAPSGSDQDGNKCWWVADGPVSADYQVHPAFMDGGAEIDQVYVGKYEGIDDGTNGSGNNIVGSASGASPLVDTTFTDYKQYCANRNATNGGNDGVEGFHFWTIYELAAIQLLALIELGTPDVQSAIASGRVDSSSAANTGSTTAVWRGIYELWGNVRHWTDGLQLDGSHQVQVWDTNGNQNLISTGVNTTSSDGWGVTVHDETGTDWDLSLVWLPKTTDGTEGNGTLADYLYASDSGEQNVCLHGGAWSDGSKAGLFYLILVNEASSSNSRTGGRLAKW